MAANEIAEYTMYLQLYKQYKLDCIAKGTVPKELVTFLGQLKAETHAETKKVGESEAPKSSQCAGHSKVTNVRKRKLPTASQCVPLVKKRLPKTAETFHLHLLLMPHLGWLNKRPTVEERDCLAKVYIAQRVVTFDLSHSSEQIKKAILDAYSDISLKEFEAQRAVKNGKSLSTLPNVTSAELKKGAGLLYIISTEPLLFRDVTQFQTKKRCPHCFRDIENVGYRVHKTNCQRRYEGLLSDCDDSEFEILQEEYREFLGDSNYHSMIDEGESADIITEMALEPATDSCLPSITPEERRRRCVAAAEKRSQPSGVPEQQKPPLSNLIAEIESAMEHTSTEYPLPTAISKLNSHRARVVAIGSNQVLIRRGEYLVNDFLEQLNCELFKRNKHKNMDVVFCSRDANGTVTRECGKGIGPLKDLMSTLLDRFVFIRLSMLFSDGSSQPSNFDFTEKEWNNELFAAGQISALAIVQTTLCPWWTLPVYNRLIATQKPGTQHPFIAGLVSQHEADKILSDPVCTSLFNRRSLSPQHVMAILDWSAMDSTKNTAIKRAEKESKDWFHEWISTSGLLSKVLMFLTGSSIIPSNFKDYKIKVKFLQLDENLKRYPSVRTCPAFAELMFPIYVTKEELREVWVGAIAHLDAGFPIV